jgi:hypothetical protein
LLLKKTRARTEEYAEKKNARRGGDESNQSARRIHSSRKFWIRGRWKLLLRR